MKIIIGSDHGAYNAKEDLKHYLKVDYEVIDVGTNSEQSCDYPQYAIEVCKQVVQSGAKGIILCGTGIGVSMVANRFKGIRAALCRSLEDARLSREHNNANILCLGGRVLSHKEIREITDTWLNVSFEEGRHVKRLEMFENLGEEI